MTKKVEEAVSSVLETAPLKTSKDRGSEAKRFTKEEILNVYRNPLADSKLFGVKDDEEFTYYWPVHNNPNSLLRIEKMKALGWEVVTAEMQHTGRSKDPSSIGSAVTRPGGKGLEHILMRMPTPLYRERALKKELYLQMTTDAKLGKRTTQNSNLGFESVVDGGSIK